MTALVRPDGYLWTVSMIDLWVQQYTITNGKVVGFGWVVVQFEFSEHGHEMKHSNLVLEQLQQGKSPKTGTRNHAQRASANYHVQVAACHALE